ncbi:MAG: hypothetical protein J2O39_02320 [Acidimicrobiales bacterium]|nr:hypothetical protein [Acidimicrobiales bacterium]MBO0887285.1 hypothetical protein [Acidimicrobiales bacterium]MBO0893186.1 hypothetical protein [Acidimicrobiales bacterium]
MSGTSVSERRARGAAQEVKASGKPRRPSATALMTSAPATAETHISVLFFLADLVYKLRKPVRYGFLDFSTRESREADCHREVDLNRRLAPDVYLGVADVVMNGVPIDHLVVMRRMPESRRLSMMIRRGDDVSGGLRDLARMLASFHASAERSSAIDLAGRPEAAAATWEANFTETEPFVGRFLDESAEERLRWLARRYLSGRAPLFRRRIAEGHICDGHGDLQADDIYLLDDGPRVLDCVEFDARLRHGDVLADLAFLAMDLERLGAIEPAHQLLADYQRLSGVQLPSSLTRHYMASRAYVRAKVACLRAAQGDHWAAQAARHLQQLCLAHLEAGQVRLVLIGGRPVDDPSILAQGLGGAIDASTIRFEDMRRELAGEPLGTESPAEEGQAAIMTFGVMLDRARTALGLGESVILDAPWWSEDDRVAARLTASETHSELTELVTVDGSGRAQVALDQALAALSGSGFHRHPREV